MPTEQEVQEWNRWSDTNLGMTTGHLSGLVVVDCDSEDATSAFIDSYPEAKETLQVQTGRGRHFYFLFEQGIRNDAGKRLGPGIDVRGEGGYVVIPPSIHANGKPYRWNNNYEPIKLPQKLREILIDHSNNGKKQKALSPPIGQIIIDGERSATLTSLAGTMRRRGMNEDSILAALLRENAAKCDPPLSESEVQDIAKSVAKYDPIAPVNGDRPLTDFGNAQRLVAQHGADLHFSHLWGRWLVWDGNRWRIDNSGEIFRRAKDTVTTIFSEAANITDLNKRTAFVKHGTKSQSEARIRAMINLAESEVGIPVTPEELDSQPGLLNVLNGTVDLETGKLLPHQREDLLTKLAPVAYDASAPCPIWLGFLDRIMPGRNEMIEFLRRSIGYSLTGDVSEQVIFFLYGTGANGKTTFLNVIIEMLGDYAKQAAPNLLIAKRGESHPTELADLVGSRFVASVEVEEGKRLAESLVKQLTGGDKMKARFMRQDFFEFNPTYKIFLAANHKPVIQGSDYAIWRRIKLVPFTVTIPENEQDKKLSEKLRLELPGILAWAVRGCLAWQRDGLGMPEEVHKATEEYRAEMDVLAGFLNESCTLAQGATVRVKDLYEKYKKWCDENGEVPLSQRKLSTLLKQRGFTSKPGTNGYYEWSGITLGREWVDHSNMENNYGLGTNHEGGVK